MCHRGRVVADERRLTGHQLVEHRAERVEVRLRRGLATERLLRGHVGDAADHHPVLREPRTVHRDREAEVADLRDAVLRQPDVVRLQVAVHHALLVGESQSARDPLRNPQRLLGRQRPLGLLEQPLHVTAAHQLGDDVRLALVLTEVEHADHVRVGAEAAHRLGFSGNALPPYLAETLSLDHGEGHVAVEQLVVREVDALLATLAEEFADLVAAACEGSGNIRDPEARRASLHVRSGCGVGWVAPTELGVGNAKQRRGVFIVRVEREHPRGELMNAFPLLGLERRLRLIEEALDLPLDALARHGSRDIQSVASDAASVCSGDDGPH